MDDEVEVVVVGGGAAGLSAALVLGRARRRVVVVDSGEPRNAPAEGVHGFLSRDGVSPGELLAAGRAEVARYGGRVVSGRVAVVGPGFAVRLEDGAVLGARRVLVATGLRDGLPDVAGVREGWGSYVLHLEPVAVRAVGGVRGAGVPAGGRVVGGVGVRAGRHGVGAGGRGGATSVPGVYAAGNVADPAAQVVSAAAAGAKAAAGINADLVFAVR